MNNLKLKSKFFFFFLFISLIIFSSNSLALTWTRTAGTSDHRLLSDLEWSMAGHTFDTDLNVTNHNVIVTQNNGGFIINNNIETSSFTGIIYERNLDIVNYIDWFMGYVPGTSSFGMLGAKDHSFFNMVPVFAINNNTEDENNFKFYIFHNASINESLNVANTINSPTINSTSVTTNIFNMYEPDYATFGGSHCGFIQAGTTGTLQCYNDTNEDNYADFTLYANNIKMDLTNSNVSMNNLTTSQLTATRGKITTLSGTTNTYTTSNVVNSNVTLLKMVPKTLPTCNLANNGTIARNDTGTYGCAVNSIWSKIF